MGRIYYAPFDDIQVTTDPDQDVWEIAAITNKVILHAFVLTSASIVAANVDLRLVRRSTSGNGSAVTEVRRATDDAAPLAVVEQLGTSPGSLGDILMAWKWEQLGPITFLPTPEMRPVIDAGAYLCLNIQSALGSTTGWSGYVCWEEV